MSHHNAKRFAQHRGGQIGVGLAVLVAAIAVVGPWLFRDPNVTDYAHQLVPPGSGHWLGTDLAGRDQLARTVAGARASLEAVAIVFALTTLTGLLVGGLAGYLGGFIDAVVSRVIDVLLGLPSLIVALAIVGALGVGSGHLVLALVFGGWAYQARLTRSLVLASHTRLDVVAARMAGIPRSRILLTHVVPGTLATVLVAATTAIGDVVLALAGLSFLGLGAQPPIAELGQMIAESQNSLASSPWLLIGPGVVVVLTVAAAMLISDALRDTLQSHNAHSRMKRARAHAMGPTAPVSASKGTPLAVRNLAVVYPDGTHAVRGIDLTIAPAECVAIVGESGCGKTTVARAALGLLPTATTIHGSIDVGTTGLVGEPEPVLRRARGRLVGYVAQDPFAACDPLHAVRHHINEAWRAHRLRPAPGEASRRVDALGVADAAVRLRERPTRWSGGMLQRATIAAASVHSPMLTIADEPTSALDADVADDVLAALRAASQAVLLVTHDLRLVAQHSDRVAVMYAGRIIETAPTDQLINQPRHPYTRALLAATPTVDGQPIRSLPGTPPVLIAEGVAACPFASRCPDVQDLCRSEEPELVDGVACWAISVFATP